jgi:hypothetical protein
LEEAERVIRNGAGRPVVGLRRLTALAVGALLVAGCGAFRREPLDVPPGHRIVLGEILVNGFSTTHLVLDFNREDGQFPDSITIDSQRSTFVITLPPGHYLIRNLRINEQGRTGPETTNFWIAVAFDVDAAATYTGTLKIERVAFLRQLRITVDDEYETAVPAIRERYPELPAEITRSLMRPA